jgi:hypothetical protein
MQMGKPIEITRLEFSANELRELALALHRSAPCDRRSLVGGTARALGRQAAAPARYDQTATAALPPEEECCGAGGF